MARPPMQTEAMSVANKVGYPGIGTSSYVLGGQRMRIVINETTKQKLQ